MAQAVFDPLGTECEQCLAQGPYVVGWDELEAQARVLVDYCESASESGEWDVLAALAIFGITVVEVVLPPGERAFYVPDSRLIVVQKGLKASARQIALLHEFSHAISSGQATHADVHALSLFLAITPQRVEELLRICETLTAQDLHDKRFPVWVAVLRARWLSRLNQP